MRCPKCGHPGMNQGDGIWACYDHNEAVFFGKERLSKEGGFNRCPGGGKNVALAEQEEAEGDD